jgi:hypothetical protein
MNELVRGLVILPVSILLPLASNVLHPRRRIPRLSLRRRGLSAVRIA